MLLEGKRLLITGVLTEQSIAFSVARIAAEQGATVVLSGFGRGLSLTKRIARRLPGEPPVIELDVTYEDDLELLPKRLPRARRRRRRRPARDRLRAGQRPSATASSTPAGPTSAPPCTSRPGPTRRWPGRRCR